MITTLLINLLSDVFTSTESSPCLETSLLNEENENGNLKLELTEDDCRNKPTTDKISFICLLSEDHKYCEELPKSECITRFLELYSNEKLNNDDCIGLKTSNREYSCVLNIDGNRWTEKIKKFRALDDDDGGDDGDDAGDDADDDDDDDGYEESECEKTKYSKFVKLNLTQEQCSRFGTFSHRYKCVLSSDGHYCIEKDSDDTIYRFKFLLLTLCLLFLF